MSEEEINKEEFSAENIRELKNVFLLGAISEFGRRKLTKYINYLEDELQSYKDKEDKIKKVIEDNLFIAYEEEESKINICYFEELQQILNEGDK